jgi:hypothetical protein
VPLLPMETTFLDRCPNTGQTVQGWPAEEIVDDENVFESVACLICTRTVHRQYENWKGAKRG